MTSQTLNNPGPANGQAVVEKRHVELATELVKQRYTFRPMEEKDLPAVTQFVRANIQVSDGFTLTTGNLGMLAEDASGTLSAAVIVEIFSIETDTIMSVSHVATDPAHRGKGIATVMLNMLHNIPESYGAPQPTLTIGFTHPKAIKLYRRAGFNVGQEGAGTPASPSGFVPETRSSNPAFQYPFYR